MTIRIWEAARATSAAPTFFKRICIGSKGAEEEFLEGGMGCNNPVLKPIEVAKEAFPDLKQEFPGREPHFDCILSIGEYHGPQEAGFVPKDAANRLDRSIDENGDGHRRDGRAGAETARGTAHRVFSTECQAWDARYNAGRVGKTELYYGSYESSLGGDGGARKSAKGC